MKRFLLLLIAFPIATKVFSQASLLSNNTNLNSGFVVNGKALVLSATDSIWTTDGTPDGTYKLVNTVKVADSGMVLFNNALYFTGITAATGSELWKTDGTAAGTVQVLDLVPGPGGSGPSDFTVYNNKVYFSARSVTHGFELWATDGTSDGTGMVKDINTGPASGMPFRPHFTLANGSLFFVANDGSHGEELWKTDGTATGTIMVSDVTAGPKSTDFYWDPFAVLNHTVLFTTVTETDYNLQIWRTDGFSTEMLRDFGTGSGVLTHWWADDSYYKFNNKLYFTKLSGPVYGDELWVTDGTLYGTLYLKNIYASLWNAVTINNKFYFPAFTESQGWDFWMSDGTPAGTTAFFEFTPGNPSFLIYTLPSFDINSANRGQLLNGKFFFITYEYNITPNKLQLWISDGTPAGTTKIKDMNSGGSMGDFRWFSFYYSAEGLYFSDDDGLGVEPWFSDGTTAGTRSVADLNPGTGASNPMYLFIYNNQLYLNANNGDNTNGNTDLFKLTATATPLPVTLLQFSATKTPDAIQLQWTTTAQLNVDRYEVERSTDGTRFTNIGAVQAGSSYTTVQSYTFADKEGLGLNRPEVYYRLRMVDKDGSFKYSSVIKVDLDKLTFTVRLAPNPVKEVATLTITGIQSNKTAIEIIDHSGRIVRQLLKEGYTTVMQFPLDVRSLAPGTYLVRVKNDDHTQALQLVKQ